jgi:hypothetical protein
MSDASSVSIIFPPSLSGDAQRFTPEEYGGNGLPTTDQTTALANMMTAARSEGRAVINLRDGNTYTTTNPFIWGGLSELTIIGGKLMSARSGAFPGAGDAAYDANWQPFRSPLATLPNGTDPYNPSLAAQGGGVAYFGEATTVATVAAGSSALISLVGTPTVGEAVIYGWDRYGLDGFPPAGSYREKITVTAVAGTAVTLQSPLQHGYDARAPEKANRAGAARLYMLNRSGTSSVRPYTYMRKLYVKDIEFVANPGATGAGVSGVPSFGGADHVIIEGIKSYKGNVTCCEKAHVLRCTITSDFEIDKMVDEAVIEDSDIGNLVGAIGCRKVTLRGKTIIRGTLNVAPTCELVIEPGVTINGDINGGATGLIKIYAYGTRKVIIDSPTLIATLATHDRLFDAGSFDLVPATITATGYTATRAAFDASGQLKVMRVGTTIYSGRVPVGVITSMVTVPTGSLFTADVSVGAKWFGPTPSGTLSLLWLDDVRVVNGKPLIEGAYARQVHTTLGHDTGSFRAGNVRDWNIRDNQIEFGSEIAEYDVGADNAVKFHIGRGFRCTEIWLDVTRAAVTGGAVGMFVGGDQADGTNIGIVASLDLKTVGRRRLDAAGLSVLGGDVLTYSLPAAPITNFNLTDNSRALADGSRACWRILARGYFV